VLPSGHHDSPGLLKQSTLLPLMNNKVNLLSLNGECF
jgi:hypothetical protein